MITELIDKYIWLIQTFIDAGDTGNYAHLAVNVAGDIYKAGFCGDAKATVQLHENDWTVEMEIPYSSLKLSGQTFSKNWKINFCRGNYGIKEISSWAKLGTGSFHDTAAFNAVSGIPADLVQIAKEQAAAARGDFEFRLDHVIYAGGGELKATLDMLHDTSLEGYSVRFCIRDGQKEIVSRKVAPVYFHSGTNCSGCSLKKPFHLVVVTAATDCVQVDVALCPVCKTLPKVFKTVSLEARRLSLWRNRNKGNAC